MRCESVRRLANAMQRDAATSAHTATAAITPALDTPKWWPLVSCGPQLRKRGRATPMPIKLVVVAAAAVAAAAVATTVTATLGAAGRHLSTPHGVDNRTQYCASTTMDQKTKVLPEEELELGGETKQKEKKRNEASRIELETRHNYGLARLEA